MYEAVIILSFIGLSLGSFINVCVYRIPRHISIFNVRSFCPQCRTKLQPLEIIPLWGLILSKGRCRRCDFKIPLRYPMIELVGAGIIVITFLRYGISAAWVNTTIFLLLMLIICLIDWEHFIIPNMIIVIGFVTGLLTSYLFNQTQIVPQILSSLIACGLFIAIKFFGDIILKKQTMGWGDVKLAGLIALFLGLQNFLAATWLAAVLGSSYGLYLHFKMPKRCSPLLPFGSFLAISSSTVFLLSEQIHRMVERWLIFLQ